MFWRGLSIASIVLAGLGAVGCLKTEADFQALIEENNTLSVELAEARKENEILTRALDDIKREQEALQLLLNAGKSNLNAGRRTSLPSAAMAAGGPETPDENDDEWQTPQTPTALPPAPATSPPPPAASPPATAVRYYVTKPGDVLSNIARANNTTTARLLELNPNLRNRRDYIIYESERLRLP